ncbi:MAG: glycosyltransferase family 2 protein [Calditrichaeota bacterium]|nr:MAG: glycosyltransferase family 2 protein [Calditrichota bacterium]
MNHAPLKTVVTVLTYNEGEKLKQLISLFPTDANYDLLVINDGSTDETDSLLVSEKINHIKHDNNYGVGHGIRTAIEYAQNESYDVIVIMAGNGKMQPAEINNLLEPIYQDNADYVQGSRYLSGGDSKNLPTFRNIAIKLFTFMTNFVLGFKGTDITCGFRAYKLKIFDNQNININQEWLGKYEMEYYIHFKVLKEKYRVMEVPVSMIYPEEKKNYSKIKPFVGWWSMIRPWIYLVFRIKK